MLPDMQLKYIDAAMDSKMGIQENSSSLKTGVNSLEMQQQ
jgi:hypothetical protein